MDETPTQYRNKTLQQIVIGIVGGTGAQGSGLAYRLAKANFSVVLGSRDGEKAAAIAKSLGMDISGATNQECADIADIVIIAVPWESHQEIVTSLISELSGKIVIDCVNPMGFDQSGAFPLPVAEGSACAQAQRILSESKVVSAFNHVSAVLLGDHSLDAVEIDIMVVGDDKSATDLVQSLINKITGMRGIYAGKMRNASQVEALTANLISINRRYKIHAGIQITGLN